MLEDELASAIEQVAHIYALGGVSCWGLLNVGGCPDGIGLIRLRHCARGSRTRHSPLELYAYLVRQEYQRCKADDLGSAQLADQPALPLHPAVRGNGIE